MATFNIWELEKGETYYVEYRFCNASRICYDHGFTSLEAAREHMARLRLGYVNLAYCCIGKERL